MTVTSKPRGDDVVPVNRGTKHIDEIKVTEKELDDINYCDYAEDETVQGGNLCSWTCGDEWAQRSRHVKVCGVMDSGAAGHVTCNNMALGVPVVPSPGSLRGQCYKAANGDAPPNEGQQHLHVVTEAGDATELTMQIRREAPTVLSGAAV